MSVEKPSEKEADQNRSLRIKKLAARMPPLPATIGYVDQFSGKRRTIVHLAQLTTVIIHTDSVANRIDFSQFGELSELMKHVIADMLGRLDPTTVVTTVRGLRNHVTALSIMLVATPFDARHYWLTFLGQNETPNTATNVRSCLHSFCRLSIGDWRPDFLPFIKTFRGRQPDVFKVIRSGECFLPLDDNQRCISYLDDLVVKIAAAPSSVSTDVLRDASILMISFQHASRRGQIALIEMSDVTVHPGGSVHLAILVTKQPDSEVLDKITVRVKHEWTPILLEFLGRRKSLSFRVPDKVPERLLFGLAANGISYRLAKLATEITGTRWTSNDFRHTGALRQADAGMSRRELARYLFQTSDRVAGRYYTGTATQAQKINEAMAISPIYSNLANIAKTRTIDLESLLKLPPDRQVGGMPHGISVPGIGGCDVGQSLCTRHPVISCYTCHKFLPLSDVSIHELVLDAFREVVKDFANTEFSDQSHPAFVQLQPVLDSIRKTIEGLRAPGGPEKNDRNSEKKQ